MLCAYAQFFQNVFSFLCLKLSTCRSSMTSKRKKLQSKIIYMTLNQILYVRFKLTVIISYSHANIIKLLSYIYIFLINYFLCHWDRITFRINSFFTHIFIKMKYNLCALLLLQEKAISFIAKNFYVSYNLVYAL